MAEGYPANVSTFTVTGRFVKGVADSDDVGQDPEMIPIVGAIITFAPAVTPPIIRIPTSTPPVTIYQETIVATTDADGYLKIDADSATGVKLIWGHDPDIIPTAWDWHVVVSIGGNFPSRNFVIPGSAGGTVDLATLTPV
jgi:hypothetical protein